MGCTEGRIDDSGGGVIVPVSVVDAVCTMGGLWWKWRVCDRA
jgi:hypothetical protein